MAVPGPDIPIHPGDCATVATGTRVRGRSVDLGEPFDVADRAHDEDDVAVHEDGVRGGVGEGGRGAARLALNRDDRHAVPAAQAGVAERDADNVAWWLGLDHTAARW